MIERPTRTVIVLELVVFAASLAAAVAVVGDAQWDAALFFTLLAFSFVGDFAAVDTAAYRVQLSSSFLAIVTASIFLGASLGVAIALVTIAVDWLRRRYSAQDLLINLVTYALFPLVAGIGFHAIVEATGVTASDPGLYLLVFAMFLIALAIDFLLIAGYSAYVEGSTLSSKFRRALLPLLPSELATALLAVGIAYAYLQVGVASVVMLGVVVLTFQYLIGALLVSQQRADELELRAKQLAGFQVALLSALLRTLDLRDRMTARHSAAVARYSREMAAAAGLSDELQDLVHTAGLLHDIGKFVLPDRILKGDADLTEADWQQIRKHPYEGARIVSEIDGYQPVGEIILAHHERIDGLGYPRGLEGDEIPELARIISVADVYDVMTARDSYRDPVSSYEALQELRRVAGTQLDARYVEIFVNLLADRDLAYRHGEDADFERELALDRRIHDYVGAGEAGARLGAPGRRTTS